MRIGSGLIARREKTLGHVGKPRRAYGEDRSVGDTPPKSKRIKGVESQASITCNSHGLPTRLSSTDQAKSRCTVLVALANTAIDAC